MNRSRALGLLQEALASLDGLLAVWTALPGRHGADATRLAALIVGARLVDRSSLAAAALGPSSAGTARVSAPVSRHLPSR